jgi:hypothetical protein
MLAREDIRDRVLEGLRSGTLNPQYLMRLRDHLDAVLLASQAREPNA